MIHNKLDHNCDPVKGFGIVNKAEIDVFLELSCFFDDPADVGNLISGLSAFSKTSLNIWKFTVHVLLKPGLENPRDGGAWWLPSVGSHRVGHDWSDLAAAAHASKGMLKILQARLQQYVNCELPDVQADFRKGRGTRDQIANICWIIKKAREFQKNIYLCFIDYAKAFDCMDHNKLENSERDGNTWPASWEICIQVRKQHLELDTEKQTGSK